MVNLSSAQLEHLYWKMGRKSPTAPVLSKAAEKEGQLHRDIETYCKVREWYYVHSRMDQRTTTAEGVPDFIIALPGGKTLWIEAKAKTTKTSQKQQGAHRWLRKLGHGCVVVRSMDDFLLALQ